MSWSLGAGLEGRRVLVTGAAGAIGREVAAAFAATGAALALHDRDRAVVEEVARGLEGGPHLALEGDLRDPEVPDRLVGRVGEELGGLDVLAHVAAVIVRRAELTDVGIEEIDLQQEVNTRATFLLNRAAAEVMRAQGRGGSIVNFSSQGWWTGGFGGSVIYAATKGAIVSMTRGLARTYGPHGIRVNAVAPGAVETPMLTDGLSPEAYDAFVAQIPLGRVAQPAELAGAVVFLASAHASYVSGAVLNVSGGQLIY
jgi:NAD(P)-dependent dehydrogenase (short-subunit alcohol dehydrogenase family)